jgi:hypothetical protein
MTTKLTIFAEFISESNRNKPPLTIRQYQLPITTHLSGIAALARQCADDPLPIAA